MASLIKKWFSKEQPLEEDEVLQFKEEDYNRTYAVPLSIFKLVGVRVTLNDSKFVKLCWEVFYWFEFLNLLVALVLELILMVKTGKGGSFQDAVAIFRMMPCVGYLLLAMAKSYKLILYRPVYENLISELRDMWPKGKVTAEEYSIVKNAMNQLSNVITVYYWCNNALLVVFLSPPFVEIFKRAVGHDVPLILAFYYWFPFDPMQRIFYETILILQTWHGLLTIWFMVCGDLLFCIFLSHITTQFDLLAVKIQRLIYVPTDDQLVKSYPLSEYSRQHQVKNKEAIESYTETMREQRHQLELTDIIKRHYALIRLSGDVEEMFSFALLVNYSNSSIIICFCGFCSVIVEKWNEMVYKSFLTTALLQTWLLSWYGQRLLESSEALSNAVYSNGWYRASKKIRNSLIIMLHRSQKAVRVTTYGFSVISLASYTTIIKTSWSYFTLLLNVYKK